MSKSDRKLALVEQEQKDIPKIASKTPGWKLQPDVIKHIEVVFTTQTALCEYLRTNPKTWRDLTSGAGTRESTARDVAINFAVFLSRAAEGKEPRNPSAFRYEFVERLKDRYASYLDSFDFTPMLISAEG
ncbi:MAG TPA: hypothetical protein VG889_14935 [Rhizomicrobium sp.]|nr:hypothetical protein [Rhizomicrobium sp.]